MGWMRTGRLIPPTMMSPMIVNLVDNPNQQNTPVPMNLMMSMYSFMQVVCTIIINTTNYYILDLCNPDPNSIYTFNS